MAGLAEPLAPALRGLLRRAALDHALTERRQRHLPLVHCGTPGAAEAVFPVRGDEPTDHALRSDVVAALTRRSGRRVEPPLVWLTRPGAIDLVQDVDVQWLAAARQAYAEAGLPLVFVVVNRHGWRDPRSQVGRTWVRLRRR